MATVEGLHVSDDELERVFEADISADDEPLEVEGLGVAEDECEALRLSEM